MRGACAAVVLMPGLLAGCPGGPGVTPSSFVRSIDTDSDKAVSIIISDRFPEDQARPVSAAAVQNGMRASGFFTEQDARLLSGPIAGELPDLEPREYVKIAAWSDDAPRYYYLFVHDGKLRMSYYRGAQELESSEAVIPADAVALVGPAAPAPADASRDAGVAAPTVAPMPTPAATPAATPDAALPTPPAPAPGAPAAVVVATGPGPVRPQHKHRKQAPPGPPLSEAEARTKMHDLDALLDKGLISADQHKRKRKEILARL